MVDPQLSSSSLVEPPIDLWYGGLYLCDFSIELVSPTESESPPELVFSTELMLWQFLPVEISVSPVGSVGDLSSINLVDSLMLLIPSRVACRRIYLCDLFFLLSGLFPNGVATCIIPR